MVANPDGRNGSGLGVGGSRLGMGVGVGVWEGSWIIAGDVEVLTASVDVAANVGRSGEGEASA